MVTTRGSTTMTHDYRYGTSAAPGRRVGMKVLALAAVFCLPTQLLAEQSAPEIKFHAQTDFFKLPPDLYFGEAAGVAVNSKGHEGDRRLGLSLARNER